MPVGVAGLATRKPRLRGPGTSPQPSWGPHWARAAGSTRQMEAPNVSCGRCSPSEMELGEVARRYWHTLDLTVASARS